MDDRRSRFEAQVLPHLDAAYTFARWLTRSSGMADDVVQEAVLRAFRSFESLRGSDVKAWLLTIVRNCHLTALQGERRRSFVPLPQEHEADHGDAMIATTPDPETQALQRDAERQFERLMASLPDEFREILVLREIEELEYREIAAVIDVPIGTVMSRLARARAALRSRWMLQCAGESHALP